MPASFRRLLTSATVSSRTCPDLRSPVVIALKLEIVQSLRRARRYSKASEIATDVARDLRPGVVDSDNPGVTLSRVLEELAKICVELREYPRAEHYLDQARASARSEGDAARVVAVELDYAALYRAQNQPERTLDAFERALESASVTFDLRTRSRILFNLGAAVGHLGDRALARKHLGDASEIAINLGWAELVERVNGQLERL